MHHKNLPQEEYEQILEKVPICCADVVIKSKKGVLVVLRKDNPGKGMWAIPGGRVHKNERLEDAAERKAFEETGLKVKIIKKLKTYETMFKEGPFESLNTGVHSINVPHLAEPIDENVEIKLDETSLDHKWINKIEENIHSYPEKVLRDSGVFK